jgi:nicotinamide-nucleotide amidase
MLSDAYPLAETLGQLLLARQWTVTTAESCTGGGISAAITDVPGSSAWFGAGFVTYSNLHKQQLLGVDPDIIARCGAVSEQVVIRMAEGARQRAAADIAVAVSGIAGPDGGSVEKPVGTVWFGWATERGIQGHCQHFSGTREQIRQQTVLEALRGLIELCRDTV